MLAVSDTSPLNYLALVGAIDILPALFTRIVVPPAVISELQHPNTPTAVKAWLANARLLGWRLRGPPALTHP